MTEKTKNILKILGIYSSIMLIIPLITSLIIKESYLELIVCYVIMTCICFIAFLPATLLIYPFFKKIQNKNFRIIFVAFIIPFLNFIYILAEEILTGGDVWFFSYILGAFALYSFGCTFIIILFIPKSILLIKWDIIKSNILMTMFGIIFVAILQIILNPIDDYINTNKLEKYDILIEQLKTHKKQYGRYPENIQDNVKEYRNFYYTPINSNKDYILTLSNTYNKQFNYCTSKEPEGCYPHKNLYHSYENFGKWIKIIAFD